jgi:hypothetical protein
MTTLLDFWIRRPVLEGATFGVFITLDTYLTRIGFYLRNQCYGKHFLSDIYKVNLSDVLKKVQNRTIFKKDGTRRNFQEVPKRVISGCLKEEIIKCSRQINIANSKGIVNIISADEVSRGGFYVEQPCIFRERKGQPDSEIIWQEGERASYIETFTGFVLQNKSSHG